MTIIQGAMVPTMTRTSKMTGKTRSKRIRNGRRKNERRKKRKNGKKNMILRTVPRTPSQPKPTARVSSS